MSYNFAARLEAARQRQRERTEACLKLYGDPKPQPRYLAETVIAGKKVAEWAVEYDAAIEQAEDLRREDRTRTVTIDFSSAFPPGVTGAVVRWIAAGRPTEYDDTAAAIAKVREDAEAQASLAVMEDNQADEFEKLGDQKKAQQHSRYAVTHRAKAEKLFAKANAIAEAWKREHP